MIIIDISVFPLQISGKEFRKTTKNEKNSCFYCFFYLLGQNNDYIEGFFCNFAPESTIIRVNNN